MIVDRSHAWPAAAAAFLASLVEFVEALTIVLAVGAVRGWRGALTGTIPIANIATLGTDSRVYESREADPWTRHSFSPV